MNVRFENVTKHYGPFVAVADLNLATEDGEFVVLLGPSGCGKTTSLRMLAGLEDMTSGDIFIGPERVNDVPARYRDIAMVFQSYALYPHMTIAENIAYPLRVRRYAVRRGSGGAGRHRGGCGIVREIEFLAPAEVTLLGERRRVAPYGLRGGGGGAPGRDTLIHAGRLRRLPAKGTVAVAAGDRLRVETPGGGGWGRPRPTRRAS